MKPRATVRSGGMIHGHGGGGVMVERRRFELPTWLLVAVMAAALGVAIWTVARDQIMVLVDRAIDAVR